jgi:3'-phosphoadenosine 5'-phosphosulfate sulfotransferase (PAPS reductase)/FAD synthetase
MFHSSVGSKISIYSPGVWRECLLKAKDARSFNLKQNEFIKLNMLEIPRSSSSKLSVLERKKILTTSGGKDSMVLLHLFQQLD